MTPEQERAQAAITSAERWRTEGSISEEQRRGIERELAHPWRSHGLLLQIVFFVLTCVALGASFGFLQLVGVPKPGILIGIVALVLAEWLIAKRRWFGTGVEAALWLGGLIAFITALPSSGKPEAILVIAGAFAASGFRVRNPWLGLIAVLLVIAYVERRFDAGVVGAILAGALAMMGLLRSWSRPSSEMLLAVVAVVVPIAGRFAADERWWGMTLAIYAVFGTGALLLGFSRRHHAFFAAGAGALGIALFDGGRRLAAPVEAKLAIAGIVLLATSWLVSRALAGRRTGLVASRVELTGFDEVLEVAGSLGAAQAVHPDAPKDSGGPGGGGSFGGAGATGEY